MIRDAGWFEESPRHTPARPPLTPLLDDADLLLDSEIEEEDDLFLDHPEDEIDLGDDLELDLELDPEWDVETEEEEKAPGSPTPAGLASLTTGAHPHSTGPGDE